MDGDDLDLLVSCWDTHLVTSPHTIAPEVAAVKAPVNVLCPLRHALGSHNVSQHVVHDATHFARVCHGESAPAASHVPLPQTADEPSDALWLLSLVCHNRELMTATAQLIVQFQEQFAELSQHHLGRIDALRAHHQSQLLALLDMPASTTNMIVDSSVTEQFVMRHADELKVLRRECRLEARALEQRQQHDLQAFLRTSAPDAIALLERKRVKPGEPAARYHAEIDVSRFAEQDATASSLQGPSPVPTDNATPAATEATGQRRPDVLGRPPVVPVRTVELPNPLARDRHHQRGRASVPSSPHRKRSPRERHPNAAMPAVVVDVSPASWLPRCLASCTARIRGVSPPGTSNPARRPGRPVGSTSPSNASASTSPSRPAARPSPPLTTTVAAIGEHLMRLAHARSAMLLLVATEAAARDVLTTVPSPELFFTDRVSSGALHNDTTVDEGEEEETPFFSPLPQLPHLKVLFTTRLWGANIVLLYTPPSFVNEDDDRDGDDAGGQAKPRPNASAFDTTPPVVEDALRLAFSWGVDMLSVAVLDSKPTVRHEFTRVRGLARDARAAERSPAHVISAEVLAQLQSGLAEMIFQTSQFRASYLWSVQEEELLAGGLAPLDNSRQCPRTIGTRYTGAGVVGATSGAAKLGEFSPTLSSPLSASVGSGSRSTFPRASTAATFNTPMAIRVFLPLPDVFFGCSADEKEEGVGAAAPQRQHQSQPSPSALGGRAARGGTPPATHPGVARARGGHGGVSQDGAAHSGESRLRYHSSALEPDVSADSFTHHPAHDDASGNDAGLRAFLYYACGESANVL